MAQLTTTDADLQTLVASQAQQLTNANLTIIALNRVVNELEVEVVELKPEKKAAERKS